MQEMQKVWLHRKIFGRLLSKLNSSTQTPHLTISLFSSANEAIFFEGIGGIFFEANLLEGKTRVI